jgi:hypothetical protein
MIPIRDTIQAKNYPIVNTVIISLNAFIFLWEIAQGPNLEEVFYTYGLVPARYSDPHIAGYFSFYQQVIPFFSSMFIHSGFFHILGNMWFLYIFGDNVEDRLGPVRYLLFYILCGLAAAVIHLVTNWHSSIPTIGASGAIAGVMGAYFLFYPMARVLTLIPFFLFFQIVELPAFLFLGFWFLMQFFFASLSQGQVGGVAWWAHIGGFVSGIVLIKPLLVFPRTKLSNKLYQYIEKNKTPSLQCIVPQGSPDDLDLYGSIVITPREALVGTRKLINISYGFRTKNVILTIPPGIKDGTIMRLRGMGRRLSDDYRGDLYLTIKIRL